MWISWAKIDIALTFFGAPHHPTEWIRKGFYAFDAGCPLRPSYQIGHVGKNHHVHVVDSIWKHHVPKWHAMQKVQSEEQGNSNLKGQIYVKSSKWKKNAHLTLHFTRPWTRQPLNGEACAWSASGMYQLSRKEENFTGKLDLLADSFPTFPFRFYLRRSHQRWAPQVNKSFFFFFFFSFFFSFISHPQISDFGLSNTNWTLLSKTLPTGCCLVRLNQLAVA